MGPLPHHNEFSLVSVAILNPKASMPDKMFSISRYTVVSTKPGMAGTVAEYTLLCHMATHTHEESIPMHSLRIRNERFLINGSAIEMREKLLKSLKSLKFF